jgi:hypothetical protein
MLWLQAFRTALQVRMTKFRPTKLWRQLGSSSRPPESRSLPLGLSNVEFPSQCPADFPQLNCPRAENCIGMLKLFCEVRTLSDVCKADFEFNAFFLDDLWGVVSQMLLAWSPKMAPLHD